MAFVFKVIGSLTALAATSLLAFESMQRGTLVLLTVLGLIKALIVAVFVLLLLFILFLVLSPDAPRAEDRSE